MGFLGVKNPFKSKTVLGALLALSPLIDKALGSGVIPPQYVPIVAGVGAVISIFGRYVADTKLSF